MEKSYGIEAARAQLGDIADHARTTGETIALTRHGRTVAVIGPADVVAPRQGVSATLLFPRNDDQIVYLPGVPHPGDPIIRSTEIGEERWTVSKVEWYLRDDGHASLFLHLDPRRTEK
ncbi:type II toxin-antitoxin system Phd/YefM family antitoxin [Streptomyces sp. SID161]|uniref:type II toxin-antitoxin system Phd/YefM family antitoxin n=1 Tax=Streptomyces sp. SID161 TaxID=2690251 RepID=UPI001367DE17|nr:type II toxin-antitoxin system Phd/YefM family antitoxin [Streptomyces sp. SID161]MYW49605.1 hypothetical protein [Streptomyces sp. SID161]